VYASKPIVGRREAKSRFPRVLQRPGTGGTPGLGGASLVLLSTTVKERLDQVGKYVRNIVVYRGALIPQGIGPKMPPETTIDLLFARRGAVRALGCRRRGRNRCG
jgi:hypothetical protein